MAEGEVDPAGEPDQTVEQLDADARLGDRPPSGLERGKALLEGTHEVDGGAPQLGSKRLGGARPPTRQGPGPPGRAAQRARQPAVPVAEGAELRAHERGRRGLPPPVDGELDRL